MFTNTRRQASSLLVKESKTCFTPARLGRSLPKASLSSRAFSTGFSSAARSSSLLSRETLLAGAVATAAVGAYAYSNNKVEAANVPLTGIPGTRHERTFIAVKPDGVQRGLVGEIIARFEKRGYKLVALKVVHPTKDFAAKHYSDLSNKPFFPGLVNYFSSGPVVAMIWEGKNVIAGGRKLVGATNPDESLPGSIRGDLCVEVGRNIVHGSDAVDSAKHEISLWFNEKEAVSYDHENTKWIYEKV
ncbi:Nucleoside diphosphate kinase 1 [Balamuthia mandrillaris]